MKSHGGAYTARVRPVMRSRSRRNRPAAGDAAAARGKRDEERQAPLSAALDAKRPGSKPTAIEPGEEKPMPVIAAAVPISLHRCCRGCCRRCDGVREERKAESEGDVEGVQQPLPPFCTGCEEQKRAQAALQEIEAKGSLKRQTKGGKNKKDSNEDAEGEEKEKRPSKRPDLKAITKMQETNAVLYPQKRIGHLPGIDVGDRFYSRAEMKEYENLTFPLATCIVMSGIYEDDLDKADEIIYTGQGGNDLLGNHRQIGSQQLKRGNLALKNSRDNGNPIRVIRGHVLKNSYTGKVYTYDGLYKVVDDWVQNGVQGHVVFKYKLKRLEGQPSLTTSEVRFTRAEAPTTISELPGLVCDDISGGQERIPIPATNLVDDPPVPPTGFTYAKSLKISKDIKIPPNIIGCDCEGDCASNKDCSCAQRNDSDLPYVSYKDVGR
ncbi:hypothetical protein PR202_ga08427 [Eleusine coracana subsp. coracana]|uniref:YDG domain-containing protein n=1 Tax=Eleusine coracana subsp. coracana TaxID=191504 RepID=A0AAV5C391_ELECO|nr:hypothetical protein PR202_ga08427 [Eleusine coracana subsp. coracana]